MNQTKLESLRNAISMGTYNVESSDISHADAGGYLLTVEILTEEEPIDFQAFSDLINAHGCIIIQVAANNNTVAFFIEEKLESGH